MVVQQKTLACKLLVLVAWFWINTILLTTTTTTTSRSSMVSLSFVVSPPSYMTKVLGGFVVFVDAVGSTGSSSTKKLFDVRQSSSSSSFSSSWLNKVGNNNNLSGKTRSNNSIRNRTTTVTANTSIVRTSKFCFVPSSFNLNNERLILHRSSSSSSSSSTTQFHSSTQTTTLLQSFLPSIIRKSRSSSNNSIMMTSLSTSSNNDRDVLDNNKEALDCDSTADNEAKRYLFQNHQGNWAGQVSKFSQLDGSVIPVPEHLVPDSMVEWGQIPPQLEQFTTDVFETIEEGDDSDSRVKLERTIIQVLPEVGCGIDNLETTKSKQTLENMSIQLCDSEQPLVRMVFPSSSKDEIPVSQPPLCFMVPQQQLDAGDSTATSNTPPSFVMILPKKTFGKTKEPSQIYTTHVYFVSSENEKQQQQRIRVMLDVEISNHNDDETTDGSSSCIKLVSPIEVVLERQTSSKPSIEGGYMGDGGGLDARTVAQLVGVTNINKPFATWRDNLVAAAPKDVADDTTSVHLTTIQIPCGVTISVDDDKRILQVAVSEKMFHKFNENNDDEPAQNINTQSVSIQFANE